MVYSHITCEYCDGKGGRFSKAGNAFWRHKEKLKIASGCKTESLNAPWNHGKSWVISTVFAKNRNPLSLVKQRAG